MLKSCINNSGQASFSLLRLQRSTSLSIFRLCYVYDYQDGNQRALSFTMHLYLIQSRAFLCEFWEFAVKMKMLIDACKVAVCWSLGANVQYTVNYSFILKSVLKWQNKSKPMKIKYYLDNNLFYLFISYLWHTDMLVSPPVLLPI